MALEDLTGVSKFIDDLVAANPVGSSDPKREGDDHIRGIKNVLKNSFPGVTGAVSATHTELNILDGFSGSTADLNLIAGIAASSESVIIFDAGTACLFYQDAAPTGWTIAAAVDEHSVRLTKGSGAGGQAGGATGGTNNFSSQFTTIASAGYTLQEADIPSHTHGGAGGHAHTVNIASFGSANPSATGILAALGEWGVTPGAYNNTALIDVVANHTHNSYGGGGSHAHNVDLAVKWAACIVCTLDA